MAEVEGTQDDERRTGVETVPWSMRVATAWSWRLLVVGAVGYFLLKLMAMYLVLVAPVFIALLLVALIKPLTDLLQRTALPRGIGALVTVLLVLATVVGLFTVVGTQVVSGFSDLQTQATAGLAEVQRALAGPPLHLTTTQLAQYLAQARTSLFGNGDQLVTGALAATSTAGHVVTGLFLTLFTTYFFLAQGTSIWAWIVRLLPRAARRPMDEAARRGWVTLTAFVRATIVVALTDALGIGTGAALLGVPLALPLGVLVFLGAFIPVVGALISGSVAVLIALVSVGVVKALLMLAVVLVVQQIESHVLQPFLLGRAVSVHPLAVILGIAAGALTAGILGALFAVPLVAVGHTVAVSLSDRDADLGDPRAPGASPVAAEPPLRPQDHDPDADPASDRAEPVDDDDVRTR
jgi:predicted PurR-regulated permease PerM